MLAGWLERKLKSWGLRRKRVVEGQTEGLCEERKPSYNSYGWAPRAPRMK